LADHIGAQPAAVSQHLAKLRLARLVKTRRQGNFVLYLAEDDHVRRLVEEALFHADHVVQGALEDPELPFEASSFDLVVLADVLEHLADPAAGLARAVSWCRPSGGAILVSVPNVAHWQARLTLLRGRWPQEESGTFDATHLRWFTRESLAALLAGAGLRDVELRAIVPALRNHAPTAARRLTERLEPAWQALGRRAPGLLGYQVLGIGRR
jgi:SAM-dependent methyltransferase